MDFLKAATGLRREKKEHPVRRWGLYFGQMIYRILLPLLLGLAAYAQSSGCNAPAASPSFTVSLPGPPFMVVPSKDGCWVFVSITGGGRGPQPGMAVLKRSGGKVELSRVIPLDSAPTGITLTHDGKLLIAAATSKTVFLDVQQMTSGGDKPVAGSFDSPRPPGSIYANVTSDDKVLFISEEYAQTITVIDLERARREGYTEKAIIGKIPVGLAPIALTFSRDAKWLYTTSQSALPDWNWPKACKPEGAANVPDNIIVRPEGAVLVVDVEKARTDPAHAVAARVPAGCSPVRMAMSPAGDRIYVTARNNNAVMEFDTSKLIADPSHAMLAMTAVGDAPVPVAVVGSGKKIVVGNSNRFARNDQGQSLVVLDAAKLREGMGAVLGVIPAGAFPREMSLTSDGRTLLLTNFGSNSLQVMDVEHLPIDHKLPPEISANATALAHRGEHKQVTVDPKAMAGYGGVYQEANGPAVVVTVAGNDVRIKIGLNPAISALPASETTFFLQGPGWVIDFPKGQAHPDSLTIHANGQDRVAKRLDEAAAKPLLEAAAAFDKRMRENKPAPGSLEATRKLIADLQAGKPDESMLGAGGFWQQQLAQVQSQVAQMGKVQSIEFLRVGPAGPDIYTIKTDKGTYAWRIWMMPDGKVDQ